MGIAVIGATGSIGGAVATLLMSLGHDVARASRHGEHRVDIEQAASVASFHDEQGELDAVASAAGGAAVFGAVGALTDRQMEGEPWPSADEVARTYLDVLESGEGGVVRFVAGYGP